MNTIGWMFILIAILIIRQVMRGRAMNIGEDIADSMLAIISGDTKEFGTVLARTGDSNKADQADLSGYREAGEGIAEAINTVANKTVLGASISLGKAAKGYRFGATGPDYYDCSGLMYRAAQKAGYKGPRFVTDNVHSMPGFIKVSPPGTSGPGLESAQPGDMVVWVGGAMGHMGVVTGPNEFYSAMSPDAGIGYAKISSFRNQKPEYFRYVGEKK